MNFLIFGSSGMAGHLISLYLAEKGYNVTGFARRNTNCTPNTVIGDVADLDLVRDVINNGKFDVIVNAVGILNRSAEDNKSSAVFVNSFFPHFLADVAGKVDSFVIHMSTDCVFAGNTGPYSETSLRDGKTFYDRSKALGELEEYGNCLTLRNSIVGPDINPSGIGLFNWFMQQPGPRINGYTGAMWTGLTTLELAKVIEHVAQRQVPGLVNMVGDSNISKYELLSLFNHFFRNDELEIIPSDSVLLDKTLVRTNFSIDHKIPSYEKMVADMREWVDGHKALYPHYKMSGVVNG